MTNYNKRVIFYNIGSIPNKKIRYVTAIGKYKNQWVLIRKKRSTRYEFPSVRKSNKESNYEALSRKTKEEIDAYIDRAIPLSIYKFTKNKKYEYGIIYYSEFEKLSGKYDKNEISEIKLTSKIEKKKINSIDLELFNFVVKHRRVDNSWFHLDSRESFGRVNFISVGNKSKKIKQNIADPMNITRTIKGFFRGYVKNELRGPIQLDINPTSMCLDSCIFCFNRADRIKDSNELDYKKTIKVIDYLCKNTNLMHIKSSGFGDPLCYKHIWDIFKYSKQKGLVTSLNTNGKALYKYFDEVLEYLDSIRFSIDAWGKDQFKEVHRTNDFIERKKMIENLSQARDAMQPNLIIGMHYVVLPNNLTGIEKMIKWSIKHKIDYIDITLDKFLPCYINKWDDKTINKTVTQLKKLKKYISPNFNIIFPSDVTISNEKLKLFRSNRLGKHPCWQILLRHYITPSGQYGACNAFDSQPIAKRIFGDIYKDSTEDILKKINSKNALTTKNSSCKNCVIPHGIFNDLCDFVYKNTYKIK